MHRRHAAGWLALLAAAVATVLPVSGPPTSMRLAADAPPSARAALAFDRAELHRASRSYARPEPLVEVPVIASAPPPRPGPRGTTYPQPTAARQAVRPSAPAATGGAWACIRQHESGGNYQRNSRNGYYGAVQWLPSTWNAAVRLIGHPEYANGRADLAPPAVQDEAAVAWQARHGWGPWPATSRACGLR
jgi:hypothetical protein